MKRSYFCKSIFTFGIIFLYIPLVVLVLFSFSNSQIINIWGGFTLSWYKTLWQDSDIINAAIMSLEVALISAVFATILGTITAYIVTRFKYFKTKNFLYGMVVTPLVLPDIVLGISLLLMFSTLQNVFGWPHGRGMMTIVFAHITFCTAYVTIVMQARFTGVSRSTEEAAMDLGATPIKTFFYITLPQVVPSLVTSFLLAFTLSIDNLVVTEFVAGSSNPTLPMYIYSSVKDGPTPEINALATIIITVIAILVVFGSIVLNKIYNKKKNI